MATKRDHTRDYLCGRLGSERMGSDPSSAAVEAFTSICGLGWDPLSGQLGALSSG